MRLVIGIVRRIAMFKFFKLLPQSPTDLLTSTLYDENSFYARFMSDLRQCQHEVIIESPFITTKRLNILLPILQRLKTQHVRVVVNTRDPEEQDCEYLKSEARIGISSLQHLGVHVLFTGGHHRKLAILDRNILYEGSLNILSQNKSREVMRRTESTQLAWQMARFVKIDNFIR